MVLYRKEIEQQCNLSLVETGANVHMRGGKELSMRGNQHSRQRKRNIAVALPNKFHQALHRVSNFELVSRKLDLLSTSATVAVASSN